MREINLMSDTVTKPTEEMRKAMFEAEVGDDVSNDDPTVNKLQKLAAEVTGKEAALFMPSGTMGNLAALLSHTNAGEEVILEETAHIMFYEAGGMARLGGLMPRVVRGKNGIMNPKDIKAAFRDSNIHFPKTTLICLENTSNLGGGTVYPIEYLKEIREIADEKNVAVHMDGARVFNAAAYLDIEVKEIVKYADSVMFCLSKGLSAPVGSMLCGSGEFIAKALRNRKALGGGMRQAGVLAAPGILAITQMPKRLKEDHENALVLAQGLNNNPCITVDMETVQTNIVYFDVEDKLSAAQLVAELKSRGIRCNQSTAKRIRMVTNRHITKDDILQVIENVNQIFS